MVDPKPRVILPMIAKVIPECVYALIGKPLPQRIGPALFEQARKRGSTFRLQQRIFLP